ncbi:MAG: glycogen synthase GlgA [Ignavibacteria bacterium]|jgi:starch synthase|nr:glycogen synthase GlgA [Ignavibacteria bacterium]MDH7528783.1 glycogen synthase GlgA [Ignavibacteria bacterium]
MKNKNLKILFITSEASPFVKTGGLADVSSALPQTLMELGNEVRLVLPKYGAVDERKFKIHEIVRLKEIPIHLGNEIELVSMRSCFLVGSKVKVQIYFFDNQKYFGSRKGLYQDINTKKDYPDNHERFILYAKGIMEMLKKLGWTPDIIHCNDWQTGLIPAYLKTVYADLDILKDTKVVFTIHNVDFPGVFPKEVFKLTGLPDSILNEITVEDGSKISFLKAGVVYADAVTTVSEKYADELCTIDELGGIIKNTLKKRKNDFYGIINGVDYSVWNPETDKYIPAKYNIKDLSGKLDNKKALLEYLKLPVELEVPVIGTISRFAEQKGIDLIQDAIEEILKLDVKYVLLGQGDKKYQQFFEKVQKKYPKKFGFFAGFNEELAHLIEAGADMYLMPSKYEPCGLTQLYALKYGTIPIVRYTGGLADTIVRLNGNFDEGTGFVFKKYEVEDMMKEIKRALKLYQDKESWVKLMKNAMSQDFSWHASAKKYVELYKKLLKDTK